MVEQWKTLPSNAAYEVSDQGRVRSRDHQKWSGLAGFTDVKGRILKLLLDGRGYYNVKIGFKNTRTVHSLVAETFIGPLPKGMHCCHNDGIKINNCLSNLRYDTPAANNADEYRHGKRDARRDSQRARKAATTRFIKRIGICRLKPEYDL